MHTGLVRKLFGNGAEAKGGAGYVDLEEYVQESFTGAGGAEAKMFVRVAEVRKYEELREFANYVYKGNVLLLDFTALQNDDVILKRVTGDLKRLVADVGGDIAGLGKTMLIVTPGGVRIDRNRLKATA